MANLLESKMQLGHNVFRKLTKILQNVAYPNEEARILFSSGNAGVKYLQDGN